MEGRYLLAIETSCDETAVAICDRCELKIISHAVFSQIDLHALYGGVVPEIAARSHVEKIDFIVTKALNQAGLKLEQIDLFAVTVTPGLVGSLLVGISFAKGLAWSMKKPLLGIDHLEGHLFSSYLKEDGTICPIIYPALTLSMSGGHTALYFQEEADSYTVIGKTIDDAAGEAFDKVGKMLGLPYPGGPYIEKEAQSVGIKDFFNYPRVHLKDKPLHFSFSGLKTAVMYDMARRGFYDLTNFQCTPHITENDKKEVASSLLACIADICVATVERALMQHPQTKTICFVGGVACNSYIRSRLLELCQKRDMQFIVPRPLFCVDNAAMIAVVAHYKALKGELDTLELDALKR